ncbi:hypothetical protein ZTR_05894 [Talaromyces verruculosus]|nr:hypothetical protein ZTR_05894 [Talaromyces verruculosus]
MSPINLPQKRTNTIESKRLQLSTKLYKPRQLPQAVGWQRRRRQCEGQGGLDTLHFAAREGGQAVVQLLVDNYADVNAMVMDGYDRATLRNGPVIGGQYYQDDKDKARKGWTPLHYAAEKGHEGIIRLLVSKGANIQAKDGRGYTPLHWATKNGRDEAVAVLVTKAAEMPKDKKGWISLLWGVAGKTNP